MLKAPASFPYPGAEALLGDRKVRIIRIDPDGRRLVQGIGRPLLTRTVDLEELSDASTPEDPFDRWVAEAVTINVRELYHAWPEGAFTPTVDLYASFVAFLAARGFRHTEVPSRKAFGYYARDFGCEMVVRHVDGKAQRCLPMTLKQRALAA